MTSPGASLRGPLVTAFVAVAVGCLALRAADDRVVDPRQQAAADGAGMRFAGPALTLPGGGGTDLGVLFDQQVFGRSRGQHMIVVHGRVVVHPHVPVADPGAAGMLVQLRSRGQARIARLEQVCSLDAGQRKHLDLALESDVRRVAGEIDAVRQAYTSQRFAGLRQPFDQRRLQALYEDAARCRAIIDGAFQENSLLAAVGTGVLDPTQRQRLDDWVAGRRAARWESMVRLVIGQLDDTVLGLSGRQHAAIVELLLADVPPLAVVEDARLARGLAGFQNVLVLARLGRLGAPAIRPLLDPRQWGVLGRRIDLAGPPAEVERMLLEQGILEAVGRPPVAGEEVP